MRVNILISDAVVRKKWKYLRDQFAVEVGKMTSTTEHSLNELPEPKWRHFKSLLFLRDFVKPRTSSGNSLMKNSVPSTNIASQEIDNASEHNDSDAAENQVFKDPTTSDISDIEVRADVPWETNNFRSGAEKQDILRRKKKRRRIPTNAKYNQTSIDTEQKKVKIFEEVFTKRITENEDELFFRSLLPHVAKIPDNMKLSFRNRVQEIVERFAYNSGTSN